MFRADALATHLVFHPLRKLFPLGEGRVPILMYHSVSNEVGRPTHPYYQTVTTPRAFATQMQYLAGNGYETIGVAEALEYMKAPKPRAKKPVVITFDDGLWDFYTEAVPVMNRFGFRATMYLPTAFIGHTPREFKGVRCLTWDQVRELDRVGMTFGSHTVTHPQLRAVGLAQAEREVRESKEVIQQELGAEIQSFAYPYAFPEADTEFVGQVGGFLGAAGYQSGVCTTIGTAHRSQDPLFLRRLPVNSADSTALLRAKLEGSYDWLHGVQHVSKILQRRRA